MMAVFDHDKDLIYHLELKLKQARNDIDIDIDIDINTNIWREAAHSPPSDDWQCMLIKKLRP